MKYSGKYSLKENFAGRGFGLLNERNMEGLTSLQDYAHKTQEIKVGGKTVIVGPGTQYPYSDPAKLPRKSGSSNAGSMVGWNTGCDLAEKLQSLGFDIDYVAATNVGPDVIASKGGTAYNFELGTAGKVTQMGSYNLDGTERAGRDGMEKKREYMKDALVATGVVANISDATGALASLEQVDDEIQRAYWQGSGDDFIVYKAKNGDFYAMALTDRAHALMPNIPYWDDLEAQGKIPSLKRVSAGSVRGKDPAGGDKKVKIGNRFGTQPFGNQSNDDKWKTEFGDRYKQI